MAEAELLDDLDYADVEDVVIAYLQAVAGLEPEAVDTVTPEAITGVTVRVLRIGGTDTDGVTDRARVQVCTYAPTRNQARAVSRRLRKLLAGDAGVGGLNGAEVDMPDGATVLVDSCVTDVAPDREPNTNPRIDQDAAYYRLATRAQ